MYEYEIKEKKKKKKPMSVPAVIIMDIVLIGISLVVFALFHHVIPAYQGSDLSKDKDKTPTPPPPGIAVTGNSSGTDDGSNPGTTPGNNGEGTVWGVKFADKFTEGEVISDENSYKSKNINVTVTKAQENGVTYYIQDIYIRKIECLRTAFAKDNYGKSLTDNTVEMAKNNKAICAINGDYYGAHIDTGVVIRNGYLYKSAPNADVGVLFYNGELKTYSKETFNADQAISEGAYQAWCFGPSLLTDEGKSMTSFDSSVAGKNPRTAIGYYEPGHYCFVTVDGRQKNYSNGMTLAELSELFESLGCTAAYNLDGGQTSMMVFKDKLTNIPYNGGRSCSDIVLVREWDE